MSEEKVEIEASLNMDQKVIKICGDGAAQITFDTSADQLAKVLTGFAKFNKRPIKLIMIGLRGDCVNAGRKKEAKTYR